jgi:hypothetical protein
MVPPCHSLGVANSRVVSVCTPNIAIFSAGSAAAAGAGASGRWPGGVGRPAALAPGEIWSVELAGRHELGPGAVLPGMRDKPETVLEVSG